MYGYPGPFLPAACNGFLLAALLTAAALAAVFLLRPLRWSSLRLARHALAVAAFAACTLAFGYWGLLGFSGW